MSCFSSGADTIQDIYSVLRLYSQPGKVTGGLDTILIAAYQDSDGEMKVDMYALFLNPRRFVFSQVYRFESNSFDVDDEAKWTSIQAQAMEKLSNAWGSYVAGKRYKPPLYEFECDEDGTVIFPGKLPAQLAVMIDAYLHAKYSKCSFT
jgi:hypothetical protein